jgi:hypothetical protein
VVICHDALLKRIYGVDAEVTSLPWEGGLDQLRTIREPHSPMLTFRHLLYKLAAAKEGNGSVHGAAEGTKWSDTWILMDIKVRHEIGHTRTGRFHLFPSPVTRAGDVDVIVASH